MPFKWLVKQISYFQHDVLCQDEGIGATANYRSSGEHQLPQEQLSLQHGADPLTSNLQPSSKLDLNQIKSNIFIPEKDNSIN